MILNGSPVSPGFALGKVYLYKAFSFTMPETTTAKGQESLQKMRFNEASTKALAELDDIIASFTGKNAGKGDIFAAHKEILCDEEILKLVHHDILVNSNIAEIAVYSAFEEFITLIAAAKDPLIASRQIDLQDVRDRILRILSGVEEKNLSSLKEPAIIVAHNLLPSDTATMDRKNVLGIVTETGGTVSHAAIIACSYRIPAVLGVPNCASILQHGQEIGLDAQTGEVFVQPDEQTKNSLLEKQAKWHTLLAGENEYLAKAPLMADGTRLQIGINIGNAENDPGYAYSDFVGLFRTEFLYMEHGYPPAEDDQYSAYCKVLQHAAGKPVVLRTLDVGGDKALKYLHVHHEDNPFLGMRALRLCFARPDIFRTQLRAVMRAAAHGEILLLLPMVGSMDDIYTAKQHIAKTKKELENEGTPHGNVKIGIMIEVPAIAAIADIAVEQVDFASIGTNDLCQYLCAADRLNPTVSNYYQSFSPAMVRTIAGVASTFNRAGKPISVCGEMAGDVRGAILLAGLGITTLSMSSAKIAAVKAALAKVSMQNAQHIAKKALLAETQQDILRIFDDALSKF